MIVIAEFSAEIFEEHSILLIPAIIFMIVAYTINRTIKRKTRKAIWDMLF